MNNIKWRFIFIAVFLFVGGALTVKAQDIINLKDGNTIEAKVLEITPREIKYRRFDNLDGPVIIIPAVRVLSVRYENGVVDPINTTQPKRPAMDPDKWIVGIYLDPSGFALYGPSAAVELTRGWFNGLFNFRVPAIGLISDSGFGFGLAFNYFRHTRIGGFYIGGMTEFTINGQWEEDIASQKIVWKSDGTGVYIDHWDNNHYKNTFSLALSSGYKFVLSSGVYFRTGGYVGYEFGHGLLLRPDLTCGYSF